MLRTGFDVPIKGNKVAEEFRIKKTFPTIKLLKQKGAKIIILSHLGRSKETLKPVAKYLSSYFRGLKFIPHLFGDATRKAVSKMKNGEIIMLENLRTEAGEENNDELFAKGLARFGDVYINEAFSVSHREHASIVGIAKCLPSYVGLLFEEEVKNLESAFKPKRPFLLILGGVKFESKLGVLVKFLKIANKIFIGGALANNFFKTQGVDIGKSLFDEKVSVKKYLNNPRIVLPLDFKKGGGKIIDIGPQAIKELAVLIKKSKFILWNGPLGNFEEKEFEEGTKAAAKLIAGSKAKKIIGGGDTITAVNKFSNLKKFSFVSTGGGAMLEFLAKGTLIGIEAILKSKKIK